MSSVNPICFSCSKSVQQVHPSSPRRKTRIVFCSEACKTIFKEKVQDSKELEIAKEQIIKKYNKTPPNTPNHSRNNSLYEPQINNQDKSNDQSS